jgi:AcrR family transcriptional regulator
MLMSTGMSLEIADKPRRRRRAPDEARREAVASARALLMAGGPTAVTLKAVADEIGVTHVNLIHHFGSAAGLQTALMATMVRDLTDALAAAVTHLRSAEGAPRALVNQVFDAMDQGGAGRLAAWIALSGDPSHLEPVRAAIRDLVQAVYDKFADEGPDTLQKIQRAVLFIALCAFGDAVIGAQLRDMLEQADDVPRDIVARLLSSFLA